MPYPPGGSPPSAPPDTQPSHRLYGREAHIAQLLRAFERVTQEGQPELLLVCGYSGIGKSSVVHALREPVARKPTC